MTQLTSDVALAGLLRLAVAEREARVAGDPDAIKTEVLLDQAGLSHAQIAEATGKKADAVRMVISRAAPKKSRGKNVAAKSTARAKK